MITVAIEVWSRDSDDIKDGVVDFTWMAEKSLFREIMIFILAKEEVCKITEA